MDLWFGSWLPYHVKLECAVWCFTSPRPNVSFQGSKSRTKRFILIKLAYAYHNEYTEVIILRPETIT